MDMVHLEIGNYLSSNGVNRCKIFLEHICPSSDKSDSAAGRYWIILGPQE